MRRGLWFVSGPAWGCGEESHHEVEGARRVGFPFDARRLSRGGSLSPSVPRGTGRPAGNALLQVTVGKVGFLGAGERPPCAPESHLCPLPFLSSHDLQVHFVLQWKHSHFVIRIESSSPWFLNNSKTLGDNIF